MPIPLWALPRLAWRGAWAGCCLFAGCSHSPTAGQYALRVESIAEEPVRKGSSFRLVGKAVEEADSHLQFGEAARIVTNILENRGLYPAPSPERTDLVVEITLEMIPPRPGSRSTEQANPSRRAREPELADLAQLRSSARGPLEKSLVLTAREAHPPGEDPPRILWRVAVTISDLSNDLRKYLPLLGAAAVDRIGTDSGGPRTVLVGETDKTVLLLRK